MKGFYRFLNSCLTMMVVLKVSSVYSYQQNSIVPAAAMILVASSVLMMLASEDAGENDNDMASDRVYVYAAQLEERGKYLFTSVSLAAPLSWQGLTRKKDRVERMKKPALHFPHRQR
jgi:hypothetical protein